MSSDTRYNSTGLYTSLRLHVAGSTDLKQARRLSPAAVAHIRQSILNHAKLLEEEADDWKSAPGREFWLREDHTIDRVDAKDKDDVELLDVQCTVERTSNLNNTSATMKYRNAFVTYNSTRGDCIYLLDPEFNQEDYVKSLPVIRIGGSGLLSVNIPTDRVDVTNPETGVSKPWDLSNHPVIKKNNQAYRIVHAMHEDEMLMYYHPVTKWVYEVSGC